MKILSTLLLLLSFFTVQAQEITLEDLFEKGTFFARSIPQMRPAGDGYYTTYSSKGVILKKYADRKFEQMLLDSLVVDGKKIPTTAYSLSADRKKILLTANIEPIYRHSYKADYFVMEIATKTLWKLTEKGKVQQATFSPDGKKIAYVRDNNLFTYCLCSKKEEQVTTDGAFTRIINGLPDWVYEEEFAFSKAFAWSPDSKQLAYMKFDETAVPTYTLSRYANDENYPSLYTYKYPKAGETNATVGVWVYDTATKENKEIDVKKSDNQYIPRIFWTNREKELLIFRLNRHQNQLEYLMANTQNGSVENVFTETNKYYIDATNFDAITFLDKDRFVLLSEQKGYRNLYIYDYKKRVLSPWLEREFDITQFYGVDTKGTAYFQAAVASPYNREIAQVTSNGAFTILTEGQDGWHDAFFDKDFTYWIDKYSTATQAPVYTAYSLSGKDKYVLEDNEELMKVLQKYNLPQKEFINLPSADKNVTSSAWRILPANFDENKKYPVLITQYNGPNSQQVKNSFSVSWYEYLAQRGYIVYCIDTRGTAARGEEFRKATYMQLGKLESNDILAAGRHLQTLPYVDNQSMTIWGWSYGGFMSSLCLFKGEDVFSAAIAVASVTHWKFYDSVYTERYMRTPQENIEGYNANSPLGNQEKFTGKSRLLLVHGTDDDNVHIQNTYVLTDKLVARDIPFEMHVYTDKNHGIYGGKTRLHLYKHFMNFLEK